jgi:2-amino-4-hydroxy-6-hydroxymethyldihydropteridine diphosphokinase
MSSMIPVLIALGSNIDAERNLASAVFRMGRHPGIQVDAVSSIYESAPVGASAPQPAYLNAAVLAQTSLEPGAAGDRGGAGTGAGRRQVRCAAY